MVKRRIIARVGMCCTLALVTGMLTGCPDGLRHPGASATSLSGDSLEIVSFDPALKAETQKSIIALGTQLTVHVKYNVTSLAGCRIFVRPLTDGNLTPGYAAHPSPIFTGSGEMDGWFYFDASTDVDQVRVQMVSSDVEQSTTFLTIILDVKAQWR